MTPTPTGQNPILIGIDVGGTFTDAVAVCGVEMITTAKVPTEAGHIDRSLLAALDRLLADVPVEAIARISLSTTLITNLLAQGRVPPVALLLVPGPGRDPTSYQLAHPSWVIRGATDFRGREIVPLDPREAKATLGEIHEAGFQHLAVVAKFSPRNPNHENQLVSWAKQMGNWQVCAGHTISGHLNFPRRAAATALTLATQTPYRAFFEQLQDAFQARNLDCPTVILKADGGTLPLEQAERAPIESIFSGPAASTMGVLAQRPEGSTSVVVDVGGTTTDLALVLDGEPLFSSRGARLEGMYLPTRAFAVHSLPVGGDSTIVVQDGLPTLATTRQGIAACLGGPAPTLTDALCICEKAQVGDLDKARAALENIGSAVRLGVDQVAAQVIEQALARIEDGIADMFHTWQREEVYRIWELKQRGIRRPDVIVGVGAAAAPVVPALAERLNAQAVIPPYAPVANALGAAVARTTFTTTLHVDTERRHLEVAEQGVSREWDEGPYTLADAEDLAREWAGQQAQALGIDPSLEDCEVVLSEQYNVVDGWATVGKIFDVRLERRCGLIAAWKPGP